ncbi:MAG: response regulator [Desulfobacteraceae bacterium]|jgi:signal transduction histidine kinase/HAMP domain-containing protein
MPFSFLKTDSLIFRINAAIWTVCAAILLVFGLFFYAFEKQQRQAQTDQAKILLDALYQQKREELANEIFANHREALMRSISELHAVKGIRAVHLFDLKGILIEWVGNQKQDDLSAEIRTELTKGPIFSSIMLNQKESLTYTIAIEVIGEKIGYFRIFFDLSDLKRASQQRILLIVAVFGSMLVVLSLVLHLLLTHSVIQPVSQIRNAMDQVMQGNLGEHVSLKLKDEIGVVADAFNAMSSQLQEQRRRLLRSMELRDSYAEQLEDTNRKLARLNTDLESIVEERTLELRASNQQLRSQIQERIRADQAKHALEERLARSQKMEALGLLAGGVAHDLNNVLSGIVSYPELILMDLDEDQSVRSMVSAIQRSGQKAAAIVQDLLALARRGVTHTSVLNINNDIILDYLNSPEFGKMQSYHPSVSVETRLEPDIMNIRGSAIHLKKTIMNLVSNAAEAQPDGGRIIITTKNIYVDRPISGYDEVNEGDYVLLQVKDYGSGIAEQDLNRIFEPFYTKKKMGRSGTGLGMAVVWGTVQDHNGYINVESLVDKCTTFEIYIPVTREPVPDKAETVPLDSYAGRGEKILVIDDVQEQREIASTLLARLQYEVVTVPSGEAALEYLKDHSVDLLVLDMIMDPGMDGLDTFIEILKINPNQRAIIASGYAENERVKEAQRLGAGAYIRKPYTVEKIARAVRAELD